MAELLSEFISVCILDFASNIADGHSTSFVTNDQAPFDRCRQLFFAEDPHCAQDIETEIKSIVDC